MFEIPEETKIDYGRLAELRKQRDSGSKLLAKLSEELQFALSAAEKKTQQLKSLRKAYAVSEHGIKEYQNDIFLLDKQCSDIMESSALLEAEYERRKKQLVQLEHEKKRKSAHISEVQQECRYLPNTLSVLEKELQDLLQKMEERSAVKQELSDEIAQALSKTSVDREEVEALMMDLNNIFLETIDRKNDVQTRLSETETSIRELTATIRDLEQQVLVLEEVKSLQNQRKSVAAELNKNSENLEIIDAEYKDTHKRLQDAKDRLDAAIQKNEDLLAEIVSLEKEVAEFDKLATLRTIAQTEAEKGSEENKRRLDELLEIFTYSVKLNEAILLTREKVKAIGEIL